MVGACTVGVMTLHMLMPAVLAVHPDRYCSECDGHIALVECARLGERYTLILNGRSFVVEAADCAARQTPNPWPMKRAPGQAPAPWLGDVSEYLWNRADAPMAPTPAMLCRQTGSKP